MTDDSIPIANQPRAGRPLGATGLRRRAAQHQAEALATLVEVSNDVTAPADARIEAAKVILNIASGSNAKGMP